MFIPLIPSPDFIQIFRSLFNKKLPYLNKAFIFENKSGYQFYSRGSEALACISKSMSGLNTVVFIPSFFCNESLNDLRNTSAKIVFYKTNMDMTPDWRHIQELCEVWPPELFVLTHYFGSVNDLSGAIKLHRNYGCELIHDCAHHLLPCDNIINSPGIIIFSPHKILPVPPLALVLYKKNIHRKLAKPKYILCKKSELLWLLKRITQKYLSFALHVKLEQDPPDISGKIIKKEWKKSAVSLFSLLLFRAASNNVFDVQKTRVENYKYFDLLLSQQQSNSHVKTFTLNNVSSPYSYIFVVSSMQKQNEIFQYMRVSEIPVNTWPDLPPEVMKNPEIFKDSIKLRKSILLLPVHQHINTEKKAYIGNKLLQELGEI